MKILKITTIALSTTLFACGGSSTETKPAEAKPATAEEAPVEEEITNDFADFKFRTIVANIPSPLLTFDLLSKHNISFNRSVIMDLGYSDRLTTSHQKAFGYGIYMSDLAYLAYFDETAELGQYIQTCRTLAGELDAQQIFDQAIASKLKDKINDRKELVGAIDEGFVAMDEYLRSNDRLTVATKMLLGSWIETQHIKLEAVQQLENTEENRDLFENIYLEKNHAKSLEELLEEVQEDADATMIEMMKDIVATYQSMESVEALDPAKIAELSDKISTIRDNVGV